MSLSILVVDDDRTIRETLTDFLALRGHTVRAAATATAGRQAAAEHTPDIVLLDLRLPAADGMRLLEALRADDPDIGVVVLTGHADVPTAVRLMQRGAADVLEKPVDLAALDGAVQRARSSAHAARARAAPRARQRRGVERPPAASAVADSTARTSPARNATAGAHRGETGTGKGYVARAASTTVAARGSPCRVNCATLSATSSRASCSATSAAPSPTRSSKERLLEVAGAHRLLDEVGELAPDVQPRLLKVLEGAASADRRHHRAAHRGAHRRPTNRRCRPGGRAPLPRDLYYRLQVLKLTSRPCARAAPAALRSRRRCFRAARASPTAAPRAARYDWRGTSRAEECAVARRDPRDGGEIGSSTRLSGDARLDEAGEPATRHDVPAARSRSHDAERRRSGRRSRTPRQQAPGASSRDRTLDAQEKLRRLDPTPGRRPGGG